jgi:type IV pilus assembly protein PilF
VKYFYFPFIIALILQTACSTTTPTHSSSVENAAYKPLKISVVNTKLGIEYMRRGKNEVALRRLQQALDQDANNAAAHNALALLYEHLNQAHLIEPHYQQALNIDPSYSAAYNNYASYLCRNERVAEAEMAFQNALKNPLYTTPERVHTNSGLCALRAGHSAQAGESFRLALQANPTVPTALYQMAELSEQAGEIEDANAYYKRYLAIAKQNPQTLWLGVRLARANKDKNTEASYALLLKSSYPDSNEASLAAQ